MEELFTITVTALLGTTVGLDPAEIMDVLVMRATDSGVLDACVSVGAVDASFTGQVKALNALDAINRGAVAMYLAGLSRITAVNVEPCTEEETYGTYLRSVVVA